MPIPTPWWYRLLVRLYPASFRRDFGPEMEATFSARWHDARAGGAAMGFLLREVTSAFRGAMAERAAAARSLVPARAPLIVGQDIRYALRLLGRTPLFTAMTVLVLAGGLGISIFTWSFLRTAVTAPLPLDEGERIVRVNGLRADGTTNTVEAAELARIRARVTTLTGLGTYVGRTAIVGTGEFIRTVDAVAAEWTLFSTTRVRPFLGRPLGASDQERGAEPVIVLGYRTWEIDHGRDSSLVGRTIDVNRVPTRVVGVMPPGFAFPVAADAWLPIDPSLLDPLAPTGVRVDAFARLAPGVSAARAERELDLLLARDRADRPELAEDDRRIVGFSARTFPMAQLGNDGPWVLTMLNGLAALILLLACINVGNLLLARAHERQREMAVRLALGAARPRLVMQYLWESIILCTAGGVLATGIAWAGLEVIDGWAQAHLQGSLAFWWRWGFDRSVLFAAGGFVTLTIVVLGGAVSLRATSERFLETLRAGAAPTAARADQRWGRLLVAAQVAAVSVVMFVGVIAAVATHTILSVDMGYDTNRLLRTGFVLPEARYPEAPDLAAFRSGLVDGLEQRPGIEAVHLRATLAELADPDARIEAAGQPVDAGQAPRTNIVAIEGALSDLGIPLRAGRWLALTDAADAAPVVLVSQALAGRLWQGADPVGRQLRLVGLEGVDAPWRTVVGVATDVPMGNPLARDRSPLAAYIPLGQSGARGTNVMVRYRGDVETARNTLLDELATADPVIALDRPQSHEEMFGTATMMANATARMFGGCFLFALLLAVSGTWGLVARSITRRTREIGIRRALGASDGVILRLLVWQGGRSLGLGALVALPVTAAGAVAVASVLPIAPSLALGTAFAVSVSIAAIVFAATWVPTRRVVSIEPRDALWRED